MNEEPEADGLMVKKAVSERQKRRRWEVWGEISRVMLSMKTRGFGDRKLRPNGYNWLSRVIITIATCMRLAFLFYHLFFIKIYFVNNKFRYY